jgi:hypothetical protein
MIHLLIILFCIHFKTRIFSILAFLFLYNIYYKKWICLIFLITDLMNLLLSMRGDWRTKASTIF